MALPAAALPAAAYAAVDPVAQALLAEPASPFVWGQGGAKLSPEQVAMLRAQGEQMAQSDFSPVGHWTQGLGRVLNNLEGGLKTKRAERMEGENRDYQARMAEALASGDVDNSTIARILMDPNAAGGARDYAAILMQSRQPKVAAPTNIEKLMLARGIQPGSQEWNDNLSAALANEVDPFVTFQGPTIGYTGRQSGLAAAMGGGGQASGSMGSPPAEAVAELQRDPTEAARREFDEVFGQGAAARVLGGPASAPGGFPDR